MYIYIYIFFFWKEKNICALCIYDIHFTLFLRESLSK